MCRLHFGFGNVERFLIRLLGIIDNGCENGDREKEITKMIKFSRNLCIKMMKKVRNKRRKKSSDDNEAAGKMNTEKTVCRLYLLRQLTSFVG